MTLVRSFSCFVLASMLVVSACASGSGAARHIVTAAERCERDWMGFAASDGPRETVRWNQLTADGLRAAAAVEPYGEPRS